MTSVITFSSDTIWNIYKGRFYITVFYCGPVRVWSEWASVRSCVVVLCSAAPFKLPQRNEPQNDRPVIGKPLTRDERVQHYLYLYLLTIWMICICICTRTGRGLTRKWVGLFWNGRGFNRYVILSMQLIWVDQKLLYLLLIRKLFTWQHQHWASDQWFWSR